MKLSNYKRKKLLQFLISLLAMAIGIGLIKYTALPVLGVPLVLGGSCAAFFCFIYFIREYEEDDAGLRPNISSNADDCGLVT